MPPNVKGGKGYRKGKHDDEVKMLQWNPKDGQMLGRALRKLGDRRFRVFCNDNKERICKLAGSMRKSEWVDEGAIIVIGVRGIGTVDIGDILQVVDPTLYRNLKKEEGVNPLLFTDVENKETAEIQQKIHAQQKGNLDSEGSEDFFDHEPEKTVAKEIPDDFDIDDI